MIKTDFDKPIEILASRGSSIAAAQTEKRDARHFELRESGALLPATVRDDGTLLRKRARNFPEMVRQLELGVAEYVVNGDFLDEFYHAPQAERQTFIDYEPPRSTSPKAGWHFSVHCAAEAEKLAHDYNLKVPPWVDNPRYFLDEPDYTGYSIEQIPARLKESLENSSPPEFARRNMYVTANALTRY
jgi:hypothetical protein